MAILGRLSKSLDRMVQREPWRLVTRDDPWVFVENVALMLGCSVDRVRRIPRSELPARSGPSKRLLYLRKDVTKYVERLPTDGNAKWQEMTETVEQINKSNTCRPEFCASTERSKLKTRRANHG